jgi:hypothetical protein
MKGVPCWTGLHSLLENNKSPRGDFALSGPGWSRTIDQAIMSPVARFP